MLGSQIGSQHLPDLSQWQDYGMGGYDDGDSAAPEDWRNYGLPEFGAYSEKMGIISCEGMGGLCAQVTPELYGNQVVARTPLLELGPTEYKWMQVMKKPFDGMMALGDDGAVYEWDGMGGFFSRIKKGLKKIGRRVRKSIRKVVKRLPGGKYLLKLGKKIWKIAQKFVKPLAKFVGKYAAKLAPIAALIPGYGPAIAAGLYTAGKIANIMNKVGATVKAVKGGNISKLVFPSGSKAKKLQKLLKSAAKKEKRRQRRGGKIKPMRARGRSRRRGSSRRRSRSSLRSISARARGQARRITGRRRSPSRSMRSMRRGSSRFFRR